MSIYRRSPDGAYRVDTGLGALESLRDIDTRPTTSERQERMAELERERRLKKSILDLSENQDWRDTIKVEIRDIDAELSRLRNEQPKGGERAFSAAALIEQLRIEYGDEKAKALIDQCACILSGHRRSPSPASAGLVEAAEWQHIAEAISDEIEKGHRVSNILTNAFGSREARRELICGAARRAALRARAADRSAPAAPRAYENLGSDNIDNPREYRGPRTGA